MPIHELLKSQKNDVFLILTETGWDPSIFAWSRDSNNNYSLEDYVICEKLSHLHSSFYFSFENNDGFHSRMSPGHQDLVDAQKSENWREQLQSFRQWLFFLDREVNTPDLWAELISENNLLTTEALNDNEHFTNEEKEYIRKGIDEIKHFMIDLQKLNPELIESQLNYLVESSNRIGRKDWKNVLIGILVTIFITSQIPAESSREIMRYVWSALRDVLIPQLYLP